MQAREVAVREARARFAELIDAADRGQVTFVTRHGRRTAAIAPAELFERSLISASDVSASDLEADFVIRDNGQVIVIQTKNHEGHSSGDVRTDPPVEGIELETPSNLSVIHGPPGTGKTQIITRLIQELAAAGTSTILITSPCNAPENEMLNAVAEKLLADGKATDDTVGKGLPSERP